MLKNQFKEYLPRWKYGENSFDFYPIVKDYDMKKRIPLEWRKDKMKINY